MDSNREKERHQRLERFLGRLRTLKGWGGANARVDVIKRGEAGDPMRRLDAAVMLEIGEARARLHIEIRDIVYEANADETVRRETARTPDERRQATSVLAAHRVASGARRVLRRAGVGYHDACGALFIPAKTIHIDIEGVRTKPVSVMERRLFEGIQARALHVLFEARGQWLTSRSIGRRGGFESRGVWRTLARIERMGWIKPEGPGRQRRRQLVAPETLLDAWTEHMRNGPPLNTRRYHIPNATDAHAVMEALDAACARAGTEYAVTGEVAARIHLDNQEPTTPSELWCRLGRVGTQDALNELNARSDDAGRLVVVSPDDTDALRHRIHHRRRWIATPLQTYLDLLASADRTSTSARDLRERRLTSDDGTRT